MANNMINGENIFSRESIRPDLGKSRGVCQVDVTDPYLPSEYHLTQEELDLLGKFMHPDFFRLLRFNTRFAPSGLIYRDLFLGGLFKTFNGVRFCQSSFDSYKYLADEDEIEEERKLYDSEDILNHGFYAKDIRRWRTEEDRRWRLESRNVPELAASLVSERPEVSLLGCYIPYDNSNNGDVPEIHLFMDNITEAARRMHCRRKYVVVAVFLQAKLEKLVQPRIHQAVRGIIAPIISLVIIGMLTYMVIGPVSNFLAVTLSNGISALLGIAPPIAGAVLGALYPLMLIFGFHWGIIPLAMNNFATMGGDPLFAITMTTNFAVAGCTLGVLLKTRNQDVRELSLSAFVSALMGGVTEPAIYGVLLKYKKPFAIVCILSGIGGIILAMSGALLTAMLTGSLMTLPALVAMMGAPVAIAAAIGIIGGAVCTFLFGYNDNMN